jgi:hypothetical protein
MNTTPRQPPTNPPTQREGAAATQEGPDLQPPATGTDGGSPAAPAMPQFVKTGSESSGGA